MPGGCGTCLSKTSMASYSRGGAMSPPHKGGPAEHTRGAFAAALPVFSAGSASRAASMLGRHGLVPSATGRDPFFQLHDLEATLPLGLTGRRGLALAGRLHGLFWFLRFHGNPPFELAAVCDIMAWSSPPARRPSAGAMRVCLAVRPHRPCCC